MKIASRRDRERRARRSSILNAADAVFNSKGFDQATMDDIAAEAELSKGTLYLYFKSKDDLFTALSSRMMHEVVVDYEALAEGRPTGIEAIRAMLVRHAEFITEHPQHFRVVIGRLASGNMFDTDVPSFAEHQALIRRIMGSFVTAIERGRRDGTIRRGLDPVQTSTQLWGAFIGTMIIRINSDEVVRRMPEHVNFDNFVDGFIDIVCGGLQPAIGGP
ncbi:MAG: TetR/AcrR family transcriptional regulator [Proteobacteria bacterium]|nr:TetR/AcrR family transcriptional regulator [Pseudomonadota bacterium]